MQNNNSSPVGEFYYENHNGSHDHGIWLCWGLLSAKTATRDEFISYWNTGEVLILKEYFPH